ncbi:MAG: hypothetical protein PHZ14_04655 [Sulfuricella sp.]|nr:hypothetical protein [Sulfuricella sp.]
MTPATIIREAQADGVRLALSPTGNIKATGDGAAVNRWLAVIRERKAEIVDVLKVGAGDTATASRWWRIHYPDRDPLEVACCPEATHAEILERHPDAIAAEPMPERYAVTATPEQETELRALVAAVGAAYAFTHEEHAEALDLALWDVGAALLSYRAMAEEQGITLDHDDRRRCDQCANLSPGGKCAAWQAVGARRGYEPVRDIPRRCEGYAPGPDDPDRRGGLERWPGVRA